VHPDGAYCLNRLLRAALAELAVVSWFLLYLGNAKSVWLFAYAILLAAQKGRTWLSYWAWFGWCGARYLWWCRSAL